MRAGAVSPLGGRAPQPPMEARKLHTASRASVCALKKMRYAYGAGGASSADQQKGGA